MSKIPHERHAKDVQGMPVFAATEKLTVVLSAENMQDAVPADDENCAIALGCRRQFQTPYVSVGRSRTDIAMPHPKGVEKAGFGNTKWAVIRFGNPTSARKIIIAADTGTLDPEGAVITLSPERSSLTPTTRRERNKQFRVPKGVKDGRGKREARDPDALTLQGVRLLTGQRQR